MSKQQLGNCFPNGVHSVLNADTNTQRVTTKYLHSQLSQSNPWAPGLGSPWKFVPLRECLWYFEILDHSPLARNTSAKFKIVKTRQKRKPSTLIKALSCHPLQTLCALQNSFKSLFSVYVCDCGYIEIYDVNILLYNIENTCRLLCAGPVWDVECVHTVRYILLRCDAMRCRRCC